MRNLSTLRLMQISLSLDHRNVNSSVLEVFDLISIQDWGKLKSTLRRNAILFQKKVIPDCTGTCCHTCNSPHSILHYVCQFHPPYSIFKLLYKANPKGVFDLDCKCRYPLHIACKHGCDPKIINFLISKNPDAVKMSDIKNRTPFLLAMKSYVQRSDADWKTANFNLMQIAQNLIDLEPIALLNEDINSFTALEYVINQELSIDLVRFIQNKTEEVRKKIQSEQDSVKNTLNKLNVNNTNQLNFMELCKRQNYVLPSIQKYAYHTKSTSKDTFTMETYLSLMVQTQASKIPRKARAA